MDVIHPYIDPRQINIPQQICGCNTSLHRPWRNNKYPTTDAMEKNTFLYRTWTNCYHPHIIPGGLGLIHNFFSFDGTGFYNYESTYSAKFMVEFWQNICVQQGFEAHTPPILTCLIWLLSAWTSQTTELDQAIGIICLIKIYCSPFTMATGQ